MERERVIIVGAGPAGLATAACLSNLSISYTIIEREDCFASMWRKYAYDRLHLHLKKQFCELPLMAFPSSFPPYVPKNQFLEYLESYVSHFEINPLYQRNVDAAEFDQVSEVWKVRAKNAKTGEVEEYSGRFLVVATGESSDPFIPEVDGLDTFPGDVIHSTRYKSGKELEGKNVLVVGSGNSGMEIALDLAENGAKTSIIIRSPVHYLSKGMVNVALLLLKRFRVKWVDSLMVLLSKMIYGDLSKYGIVRPKEGPFYMKVKYGKYPAINAGTLEKIKSGEIQVLSDEIGSIKGEEVTLKNGNVYPFDTLVFCTGFTRSTHFWLHGDEYLLGENGLPKPELTNHWKGKNGLYCVGLARRGLYGASADAQSVANDIKLHFSLSLPLDPLMK